MIDIWVAESGGESETLLSHPDRPGEERGRGRRMWSNWNDSDESSSPFRGGIQNWRPTREQEHFIRSSEVTLLTRLLGACESCVVGWRPMVAASLADECRARCVACVRLIDACAIELAQLLASDDDLADVSVPRARPRMMRDDLGDPTMWERLVADAEECVERACRVYEHARLRTSSFEVREMTDRHLAHMQGVLEVVRELRSAARDAARTTNSDPAVGCPGRATDSAAVVIS